MGTNFFEGGGYGETILGTELLGLAVLNELIGPTDAFNRYMNAQIVEFFENRATESTYEYVIFESEKYFNVAGYELECTGVQWFGKARVHDRGADAFFFKFVSDFLSH